MALSANVIRNYRADVAPEFVDVPVKASTHIYAGEACTDDSGNGVADTLTASESFLGFAEFEADNTSGAVGAINVKLRVKGTLKDVSVTGASGRTDYGVAVYMSDDNTFTLTSSTTFVQIGKVERWITSTYCDVYFEAAVRRSI
jgi:hypothetical protein